MNKYRSAALVLAACAAGLSVAACSAGTPSASSSTTSPAATGSATSSKPPVISSPVPTTGPPIAGTMLTIKGKIGSFPVPKAAKVGENMSGGTSLLVVFGLVAPPDVARFYATALPQAGYTVTSNSLVS
ncbi:MAG TPA: hypothetical protein VJ370_04375, partial [Streptosporangiaceae bacterium]|nr:hypothetical protein [Streptosporangiaceae bacterium]